MKKKDVGVENIPIKFLKMTAKHTSSLLSKVLNNCRIFRKVSFHQNSKSLKLHQCTKVANYRPISVLSTFSKVFEKIIYYRLNNCFNSYNILAKQQFGFRAKHSTSHAIFDVITKLLCSGIVNEGR